MIRNCDLYSCQMRRNVDRKFMCAFSLSCLYSSFSRSLPPVPLSFPLSLSFSLAVNSFLFYLIHYSVYQYACESTFLSISLCSYFFYLFSNLPIIYPLISPPPSLSALSFPRFLLSPLSPPSSLECVKILLN